MSTATVIQLEHPVRVGLDAVDAGLSRARGSAVWALSDDELEDALAGCETLAARIAELELALIREADARDLGRRLGASSTAAWLRHRYRLRPGEAKARLDLAHRVDVPDEDGSVRDWAATVSAPSHGCMPATAAALRDGAVSADHARVVARTLARLPSGADPAGVAAAEADLARYATQFDPATLTKLGDHLVEVVAPDTLADDEDTAYHRRELSLDETTGTIRGKLDREGLAMVRTALDPLAAPCPASDGTPDPRSASRRLADALVQLAEHTCNRGDDLPTARGARPHLIVTVDLNTLLSHTAPPPETAPGWAPRVASGSPPGTLAWGGPISGEAVRRLACDAGIVRVITDPDGVPLDVGRQERTVTPGIYAALVVRDGGCAFPGCTRPAAWCHAHHIVFWADGGDTSLDNTVLLCGFHHRTIHHCGWQVRLSPDDRLPEFIPPAWIDPDQTPQSNNRHRHHRPRHRWPDLRQRSP